MKFYSRLYDDQFAIIHFAIPYKEWSSIIKENGSNKLFDDSFLKIDIENKIDAKIFKKYSLISIGKKDISYLLYREKDKPIIGVARCICLPYISKITMPKLIDKEEYQKFESEFSGGDASDYMMNMEIEKGMFFERNVKTVKELSLITYDLSIYSNDTLIEEKKNQVYDMYYDIEFDEELLLGKKCGDSFTIRESSKLKYIMTISKITNRVLYTTNHFDDEKLSKLGYNTYEEYVESVVTSYKKYCLIDYLSSLILEFAGKNTKFVLSKKVMDFYKERRYLPFERTNNRYLQYLKVYYLEVFSKMFTINSEGLEIDNNLFSSDVRYVIDYVMKMNYNESFFDVDQEFLEYETMKLRFLEYCDKEGIIKGIKYKI